MAQPKEEWLHSIATRAEVEATAVEEILSAHRIQPSPVLAQPRRLVLKEIEFSGEKDGVANAGAFAFSWTNLDHGLWAMLSEHNLRGKSTIIEIVRWMIRGRPSSNLQDDVRRWVHAVRLCFLLDSDEYEIVTKTQGEPIGSLFRIRAPGAAGGESGRTILAKFTTDGEFEAVMADFFMRAFAMDSISTWRQGREDEGQSVTHSWVAFSGAMFIGTNYEVLLGDMPVATGLTSRLMQMYLGVPWVSTLAAAKAAQKIVEQAIQVSVRKNEQGQESAKARIASISDQLVEKRAELAKIPSDEAVRNAIDADVTELADIRRQERAMVEHVERAVTALREITAVHQEDRRDLQTHMDAMSATAVFRRLEPKCCPRCDHTISKMKKELENSTHSCSVCGESITNSEDAEAIKAELQERTAESEAAVAEAAVKKKEAENELTTLREKIDLLQNRLESSSKELGSAVRRQEAEIAIAVLEGRLDEASLSPVAQADDRSTELKILSAVVVETEARVKAVRDGLLTDVSARLVEYARTFGMENLSEASLKGNAALSLIKGGVPTSYSKVTEGEKLRLKVATVLAMIEIAEARGIGRHPGLLMIDSPAAQEVSPVDVDHLITGLQAVFTKLPHFQVFVAGISSKAITDHIPETNRREVTGNAFLW
ncbi:large ATP-binding protein [Pseudomonas aeruginosa]|uniref:large ATP-binding protein n=1 Tax=Pseudomonas TaxID=286 RepID=UPI000721A579|nr:large ATP-binding protein [Pseudomonas aeruginosa]EME0885952.1 large ATP-binding protein [Pseudomonas aeruginosa]BAT64964.1 putative large ATP-binding protein [Pseudomonas aeruginosa]HCG0252299.1 large ATP-binding protein [Pseudomonas aeruginosa]